ncbi:trehalose-phosphatase [Fodinicurvata sp. EGI_FJ10296]|uniref:trehalose-phosphatase n=1 Tax=Fodinicurvata sp. EGI_FJ10296 TaxID=3231908 RepID=UPI003455677E
MRLTDVPEARNPSPPIRPLAELRLDPGSIALFLDVDGTLVEIVDRPDLVTLASGLVDLLARLHDGMDGAVALVSGRTLVSLNRMFAPLRLSAAGQHGLEIRLADGTIARHDTPPEYLAEVDSLLTETVAAAPGLLIERKGLTIAVHYRNADHQLGPLLATETRILQRFDGIIQSIHGKKVIEFKPVGINKASAVETLMTSPPFAGRHPVFAGDDTTDEDGFAAAIRAGGVAIQVGDREPTLAQWRTPTVGNFIAWLTELAS